MCYLAFLLSIWAILLIFWSIVSVFKTTCSRQFYGAEGETISIFLRTPLHSTHTRAQVDKTLNFVH